MKTVKNEIDRKVDENLNYLKNFFGNGMNLTESSYQIMQGQVRVGIAYITSMADTEAIHKHVVIPLLRYVSNLNMGRENPLSYLKEQVISATDTQIVSSMAEVVERVLEGDSALFIEGGNTALIIGSRSVEKRSVESPENESTVFGSQESFTDDIETNTGLIVKRLPVPNIRLEKFTVGTLSRTTVKLLWLDGVADSKIIGEARNRIRKINVDHLDGIGTLAELIEDKPLSIFPKYRQTERPDAAAKSLADGRFVILCNNSPFAFFAPAMFWDNFKTTDDYQEKPVISSYLRFVRFVSFFISTLLSSLYLSFVTYNQAIIPSALALSIASGREGVPFPSIVELILLSFAISIIREAGLRMHGSVGYFVGALAAVVIGQAVVTAGYISSSLIIVVAISTIASFAIASTTLLYPARLLNYFFIFLAGFFGIFGVINGIVLLFWHLCSLSSFGVPYLYPVLPLDKEGIKDVLFRPRLRFMQKRMALLSPGNRVRSRGN